MIGRATGLADTALLLAVSLSLAAGQFLFKRAGLSIRGYALGEALWRLAWLPSFYLALAIYASSTILWIYILSRVPLSTAYPWIAIGTVLVPLLGWLVFDERVGPLFWPGLALVVVGVALTQA